MAVDLVVVPLLPLAFVVPARVLVDFDAAAFDGARFAVVPDGFVAFDAEDFDTVLVD